jgi:uncharacterized coiled-coil DUF342 family protein
MKRTMSAAAGLSPTPDASSRVSGSTHAQAAGQRDELDRIAADLAAARADAQHALEQSVEARTQLATAVAELVAARLRLDDERTHANQRLADQREAHETHIAEVRTSYEQRITELRGELLEARTPASGEARRDGPTPPPPAR